MSISIIILLIHLLPCFTRLSHAYSPPQAGTRLAAWSECVNKDYIPRVYYQANDSNVYEVSYVADVATWRTPKAILNGGSVLPQTPLAVVHFTGSAVNGNTNRVCEFTLRDCFQSY
jgi:hypothetical protein